mgnify:CR=1 FL=1
MKTVDVTLVVKDGGYEQVRIPSTMLGDLAYAIQEKGSEVVQLASKKFNLLRPEFPRLYRRRDEWMLKYLLQKLTFH